jgi:hypothetical protein
MFTDRGYSGQFLEQYPEKVLHQKGKEKNYGRVRMAEG